MPTVTYLDSSIMSLAARLLVVDGSIPMTSEAVADMTAALENTLSIACNFNGSCRIPFISFMMIISQPEVI